MITRRRRSRAAARRAHRRRQPQAPKAQPGRLNSQAEPGQVCPDRRSPRCCRWCICMEAVRTSSSCMRRPRPRPAAPNGTSTSTSPPGADPDPLRDPRCLRPSERFTFSAATGPKPSQVTYAVRFAVIGITWVNQRTRRPRRHGAEPRPLWAWRQNAGIPGTRDRAPCGCFHAGCRLPGPDRRDVLGGCAPLYAAIVAGVAPGPAAGESADHLRLHGTVRSPLVCWRGTGDTRRSWRGCPRKV